jgi:hypothetical protein
VTYWALTNPWDPDDPNRACFTCGAPPGGRFQDGSPRYPDCHHRPVYPTDLPPGWTPTIGVRVTITLAPGDLAKARACVDTLVADRKQRGLQQRFGARTLSEAERYANDLLGAQGEIAFARLTGLPWKCRSGAGKPDVGAYQVRTVRESHHKLIIHPEHPASPIVLMERRPANQYALVGWLSNSRSALRPEWAFDPRGAGVAYFIPRNVLRAPQTLPELASRV